jgi:DNA-directed RNA polymerase subunit beta
MADNDLRYIYTSPSEIRDRTEKAMVEGIMAQFPMENKLFKLEASNIRAERKEFTHKEEKEAILRTKSLTYPIKGDINLIDKRTGKIVDSVKNHPLSDTFAITDKHTLLYKGNNYSVANLMQLLPGVYTRSKATGELEADINTGTGRSFSLTLDPESQLISTEIATSKIPIAPLLRDVLGISDREITKHIPADVWQKNLEETKGKEEKHINSMYTKLVSRRLQNDKASYEDKKLALREAIESSKLHPLTTEITLGKKKDNLDGDAIVSAMGNLIKVHRGERDEDRRDSLEFKRVQNLPDFIKRRFDSERSHETVSKTKSRMTFQLEKLDPDKPDLRQILPTKPFNKVMTDFIITSTLSATPEETNPIHSLENIGKVGVIAPHEAGIKSEQQAPTSTRNIDPSHLGIIDPNRTPESGSAGLDQRCAISAMRDDEGILYTKVKDKKGQLKSVSVQELMKKVVGFPHQENVKGKVQAQVRGKIQEIDRSLVDYWIPAGSSMYTFTTNMVPFLNSDSPGRLTMAGKAITQALSLKDREEPLVQTLREDGTTFIDSMGKLISTLSPDDGEVVKVTPTEIHLKTSSGLKKVDLVKNLPFNLKGFHDDEASVSVGQKVHRGDVLADNNYTKNGKFALGRNMYVGYMPYKGYNHEDGMVISRSAASKLKSLHAAKYDYSVKQNTVLNKAMFKRFFPGDFSPEQLSKLDDQGYVKKGTRLQYGDPIIAVLEKRELSDHDRTFGNLHKSLVNPYNKIVQVWDAEEIGEVVDSYTEGKNVRIMVRAEKPIEIGDKLTGLHGNKGVVSMILEDEEMPSSVENGGKPFDIMLNPASVTSRVNLGQIMETVAGKIAQKEGKPFQMTNYGGENNLAWLQRKMAKVGVSDTDTAIDPKTGKEFGKILAGPQYFLKLSKTTESNYSARNVGGYDAFKQPIKGGDEGSKGVGFMEFLGLLGSDARKNLKEIGTLKSEENTEFWDKFMRGQPLPKPQVTFATKKFFDYLRAAGVNVKVDDNKIIASPLTDRDILSMSKGEIKDALLVDAKSLAPEKGGLFDAGVTGGFKGKNWSHYTLAEPVVNPTFETPVKSVLGLSGSEFNNITSGSVQVRKKSPGIFQLIESRTGKIQREVVIASGLEKKAAIELEDVISALQSTEGKVGGAAFEEMLGDLDVGRELALTRDEFNKTKSKSKQNTLITKMKYLNGLSKQDFAQPKDAYILRNVPVLPPIMRPAIDQGGQRIEFSDVNRFYRDHIILNRSFKDVKDRLPPEMLTVERKAMYDGVKAMMGLGDAIDPQTRQRGLKGIMVQVGGETGPKQGMFQSKILSKKQDFSGRVTISASPEVGFNDAQIPKDQMWMMFKMHIIRDLVKNGYRLPEAKKAWEDRSPSAQNSFEKLRKHIPVIINRAPTLMRTNIMAVFGTPVEGKTLGLNILHLPGFAADFDGDAMSMFVPMTEEAIKEAKDKLLPMHHINDARRGFGVPMFTPGHEAILGSVHLTEPDTEQKTVAFKSEREALNALKEGKVSLNTPITITGKK